MKICDANSKASDASAYPQISVALACLGSGSSHHYYLVDLVSVKMVSD